MQAIDKEHLSGFGQRLFTAAAKQGYESTMSIAIAIREHDVARRVVMIREKRKTTAPYDVTKSIQRIIQKHLSEEYKDAWKVPSQYMYAYSLVLDCSLDYLYGTTDVISSDIEIADICKKTGLAEESVIALIESTKNNQEADPSCAGWWSQLMNGDSFYMIPTFWHSYAEKLVQIDDLKKKADAYAKSAEYIGVDSPKENPELFTLKAMQDIKAETIEKIIQEKIDSSMGAYHKMMFHVEGFLTQYAQKWALKQHPEYDEMYYKGEMNKVKIIESVLKTDEIEKTKK